MKSPDKYAVPLCAMHHSELHDKVGDEELFFQTYGIDALKLAADLWALHADAKGDHAWEAYRDVVIRARAGSGGF